MLNSFLLEFFRLLGIILVLILKIIHHFLNYSFKWIRIGVFSEFLRHMVTGFPSLKINLTFILRRLLTFNWCLVRRHTHLVKINLFFGCYNPLLIRLMNSIFYRKFELVILWIRPLIEFIGWIVIFKIVLLELKSLALINWKIIYASIWFFAKARWSLTLIHLNMYFVKIIIIFVCLTWLN